MKCVHTADDAAICQAQTFDHQIETDGASCSIPLKRNVVGKRAKEPKSTRHRRGSMTMRHASSPSTPA